MTKKIQLSTSCPQCGHRFFLYPTIDATKIAPTVKSGLVPDYAILKYTITTDMMTAYLTEQVRMLCKDVCDDVHVQVAPFYCEKKQYKGDRHCSYASLKIALNGDRILKGFETGGWYSKIGESGESVELIDGLLRHFYRKYRYDKNNISKWMNYKTLDQLEAAFGITEEYLYDLKKFADPVAVKTNDNKTWVIFAADPALVIQDMLKETETRELSGSMQIVDIRQINKDLLEYTVNLFPKKAEVYEDPNVRTILTGAKD